MVVVLLRAKFYLMKCGRNKTKKNKTQHIYIYMRKIRKNKKLALVLQRSKQTRSNNKQAQ